MLSLFRDIYTRLYGSGTVVVGLVIDGLNIMTNYKIHSYQTYNDNTIEIMTEDDTHIYIELDKVESIEKEQNEEYNEYSIVSKCGWTLTLSFV